MILINLMINQRSISDKILDQILECNKIEILKTQFFKIS